MKKLLLTFLILFNVSFVFSQNNSFWKKATSTKSAKIKLSKRDIQNPKTYTLNLEGLKQALINAPKRNNSKKYSNDLVVSFPNSQGELENFNIKEASVMHPDLQAKYPNIRSYVGQGVNDPSEVIRFSVSPLGLHSMTLSPNKRATFIEPFTEDLTYYRVYDRSERINTDDDFECEVTYQVNKTLNSGKSSSNMKNADDAVLRTYRLVVSATGEYTQYHGGTKALALAAINTTMTRVNGIYESDFNVTLQLIANTDNVIYTSTSSDPYGNTTSGYNSALQNTLTSVIGEANYDIGHLFANLQNNGNAGCIGCVCVNNQKGSGWTSHVVPEGDPFDVDYVAHEMGHQFGGNHTWTFGGNEGSGAQMEPGSGSTIMGYAGITGVTDVQSNSDPYFHAVSIEQITDYIKSTSCQTNTSTGNAVPVVNAGSNYTIPKGTPFVLNGTATDANTSDVLSYCWEQMNNGSTSTTNPSTTATSGPAFRSFNPTTNTERYFPRLETIKTGATSWQWEAIPSVARSLNFRLTVRDNVAGGGNNSSDDMTVTVNGTAGPFVLNSPNTNVTWNAGTIQTINWDVAGTTGNGVNAANVDILLSIDGGDTYPISLASGITNDGSHDILVPNNQGTLNRIMVKGANHIFFDISNANFTIAEPVVCNATIPATFAATDIGPASATLNWDAVLGATYDLQYRQIGSGSWTTISVSGVSQILSGLNLSTQYEAQIRSKCPDLSTSAFSSIINFTTLANLGCTGGITSYPYAESFENTLGGWTQSANDDINWTVDANGTPSSNTGPSSALDGAYYIYVEASGNGTGYPNKRAIINSPCFDLSGLSQATFSFNYHMYGATNMGTIDLEASADNGVTWSSIWSKSGNQGNSWFAIDVDLNAYVGGSVQLRFNRFVGNTWQADIAIDNVNLFGIEGQDTIAPLITLNGASTINLNVGETYTELGASANDNLDGDITANIVISGDTVDTLTPDTYVVTYNVIDAAGNAAIEVIRTVTVSPDTIAPIITLTGSSTVNLNIGGIYTEQGATASDNVDGDLTSVVVIGGDIVDTNTAATYLITYNVSDAAGNAAIEVMRTVIVAADTSAPVMTLIGASSINLFVGDPYNEQGATATDNVDGDVSANIVIGGDTVNTNIAATYIVTYNVSDLSGNTAIEVIRTVIVEADSIAPNITLIGSSTINLNIGDTYIELGATATDNVDGDISADIIIGGATVDTNTPANYIITYNVSDAAGNAATEITRTVIVNPDTTIPVITLTGASTIDLIVGDTYNELGATATDNIDGNITTSIVISGVVDTNTEGTYIVAYNVSDSSGNGAIEVSRTININPVVTNIILNQGFFETGLDGWTDGGSDCARRLDEARSYENSYSIRIRDNSGTASSMTLSNIDVTPFTEVEIDFYFYVRSMENNEDFWLRFYNGSAWSTVQTWTRGVNINNNTFYNATVTVTAAQYNFAVNSGFRFQNDASGNNDQIFIDQVTITGIAGSSRGHSNNLIALGGSFDRNVSEFNSFEEDFKIYPNPVKGAELNVLVPDTEKFSYRIINMIGQTVENGISAGQVSINRLKSGMYFIEVNDGEELMIKKFIKE